MENKTMRNVEENEMDTEKKLVSDRNLDVNYSFDEVSKQLKESGIVNYQFMLKLYDKRLINIDPYDPLISKENKELVKSECKRNIWYFLRDIVKIPVQGGGSINFRLNRQNCAQIFCYELGRDTWSSSPRQLYRTISTLCIQAWETLFCNHSISTCGPCKCVTEENLNKILSIINLLPKYLVPDNMVTTFSAIYSKEENKIFGPKFALSNPGSIHFSDAEFIFDIDKIDDCIISKEENSFIVVMFESVYNCEYDITGAKNILDKAVTWDEKYYDCMSQDEACNTGLIPEGLIHILYHYDQLFNSSDDAEYYYDSMVKTLVGGAENQSMLDGEVLLKRGEHTKEEYELREARKRRNPEAPIAFKCSLIFA